MKFNLKFSIIIFIVVVIIAALIQAGQKQPIDWRKTFNPKEKIPYGTYVLKHELKNILKSQSEIKSINVSLYQFLAENKDVKNKAILFIGDRLILSKVGQRKMFQFVKQGGTFFISANHFNRHFLDSLSLDPNVFNTYETNMGYKSYPTYISLYKIKKRAYYNKLEWSNYFATLPKDSITILGALHKSKFTAPNFVQIRFGKGQFFIHLTPEVFTNYYVLQKTTFPIAFYSMKYLKGKDVFWYNYFRNNKEETTPLRFILKQPSLQAAWYILLLILLIYLIFQSRRKQRAVPIIIPEANRSVDFAKTIASMYYENGAPRNMVEKKLAYFFHDLRKYYHIETDNLLDKKTIETVAQLTAIPKADLTIFFTEIETLRKTKEYSIQELKKINVLIENFKEKAKMKY